MIDAASFSKQFHLTEDKEIQNGAVFTSPEIVRISLDMLKPYINSDSVICDFGAGYGAFVKEALSYFPDSEILATEIDPFSCCFLQSHFPGLKVYRENSLLFSFHTGERPFVAIGNPPYNDFTSQYKKNQKGTAECLDEFKARDIGVSFLKMFSAIDPDLVCILHPLSYLIKKQNFLSLSCFFDKYVLVDGVVFSSHEFASLAIKHTEFPVVAALYKRSPEPMTFEFANQFRFRVYRTSSDFIPGSFITIDGAVSKYPRKHNRPNESSDYCTLFYTLRDINALRRNQTFLGKWCPNALYVPVDKFLDYVWIDVFKRYFDQGEIDYLFGNLSPLFPGRQLICKFKSSITYDAFKNNSVLRSLGDTFREMLLAYYDISLTKDNLVNLSNLVNDLSLYQTRV